MRPRGYSREGHDSASTAVREAAEAAAAQAAALSHELAAREAAAASAEAAERPMGTGIINRSLVFYFSFLLLLLMRV